MCRGTIWKATRGEGHVNRQSLIERDGEHELLISIRVIYLFVLLCFGTIRIVQSLYFVLFFCSIDTIQKQQHHHNMTTLE